MRWLVTLLLLVLVLAGGLWLAAGDRVRTAVGVGRPAEAAGGGESFHRLDLYLKPDAIRELKLTAPGQPPLTLTRTPDGAWSQPGNWPLREGEVATLVTTLTTLRSRFAPVPVLDGSEYGLNDPANAVTVAATVATDAGPRVLSLKFGRPAAEAGAADFARPCYLRVEDVPEVVQLGPDVYPVLARSPDVYRRRQLFPDAERVKLTGGEAANPLQPAPPAAGRVAVLGDRYRAVRVEKDGTGYTLTRTEPTPEPRRDPDRPAGEPAVTATRLAAAWTLDVPAADPKGKDGKATATVRDRPDPAKLRAVLTAVPDLWVEKFVDAKAATGLDKPERTVAVTRADGRVVAVLIGGVSRTETKAEAPPPAQFPGAPPQPPKITTEEYRYAKLKDNDLVFELRTDKLADVFADPQDVRDPLLARFETGDVTALTVAVKGKPPVAVTRKKGNKDAEKDEDKQDRWLVGDGLLAEAGKVTELLDQLAKLEAKGKDAVVDLPDAAKLKDLALDAADVTKVTVTTQAKVADGETPPPAKTWTYLVGKDEVDKKKLAVRVAGWERVNLVDDAVAKLIDRPALAYRSRRLFDTADLTLDAVTVKKDGAAAFALAQQPKPAPATGTAWALTQPVKAEADAGKAGQLAGDLSRLEVAEYVDDDPKPDDLDKKYGLAKPRLTVTLGFAGPGARPQTLDVGAAREGKPEAYARLNGGGSVFAVAKTLVDAVDQGAVAFLPLQLWSVPPEKVTAVAVRRGDGEAYTLTHAGDDWKLTGPFDAAASAAEVQPLAAAVATVKADKYEALSSADPAKYGLDKPAVRVAVTYKESRPGVALPLPPEATVTKTLVVGKETAPGAATRFAKLEGGPADAVFVLPDPLVKEADKPALARLDRTLLSLDPATINKVQIAGPTPDAAVTLTKDDKGAWKADGAAFAVDGPTVTALVATAARPPVARLVGYGAGVKWADLGLDKPEYTVTLTPAGDKPTPSVVKLGKLDPVGERFVRVGDGPAAGVLNRRAAESLARGKLDFVDKTLLTFDPQALTAIDRKAGKGEFEVAQNGLNWEVTKPAKQKADKPTVEDLAEQLSRLRAAKVAAYAPADLDKPFGLKTPAATLTFKLGDKETKGLKLGNPVDPAKPDGDRYVAADGPGPVTVGVLPAQLANQLLADPLKFRDKTLAKFVDADKLTLVRGDRTVTFAKVDGTWKVTAPLAADAEQTDLDELVNALANLRADEFVADKPADLKTYGLAPPDETWTLFAGDKEVFSLAVGAKDKVGKRAYAKLAKGDVVALLDPALTTKVFAEYRKRAVFADLDASQAESLVVSAGTATFMLRKDGAAWADPAKPGEPVDTATVTDTLATLAGLKAERYAADQDAKLALYGLEKPSRVIVVTVKGGPPRTLQLGGPVGGTAGKQVYAKLPDRPAVFVLSEADTAKLTRDRAAYAGKK